MEGFGIGRFRLGLDGEAPGFGDAARCLGLGWGPEVVGSARLGEADGDERLDFLFLEGGDRGARGEAGIGGDGVRQADAVLHGEDRGGEARRLTASNSTRSSPPRTSARRKRTNAVRSGVGSCAAKPQKRRKLARSSSASASVTSDSSCQVASSNARAFRQPPKGGQQRQGRPAKLALR
jgi:hypothetical protein